MGILAATARNIRVAAGIVKRGGLVVYPTDTVYGLGCDPFSTKAVERLLQAKGGRTKPLPILASNLEEAERAAIFPQRARKIGKRFWPGPLTLVLLKKKDIPDITVAHQKTVGVRVPNHRVALELIRWSGGLLVGTSANKSGLPPPTVAADANTQLGREVDVVLDGGQTPIGVSSTIVDLSEERPKILRMGVIDLEEILRTEASGGSLT